jgi:hypothetical protein
MKITKNMIHKILNILIMLCTAQCLQAQKILQLEAEFIGFQAGYNNNNQYSVYYTLGTNQSSANSLRYDYDTYGIVNTQTGSVIPKPFGATVPIRHEANASFKLDASNISQGVTYTATSGDVPLSLIERTPGIWFSNYYTVLATGNSYAVMHIRYVVPNPEPPFNPNDNAGTTFTNFCINQPFSIITDVKPYNNGLSYTWEFQKAGDISWTTLPVNIYNGRQITVQNPLETFFNNMMFGATNITFRVKAKSIQDSESGFSLTKTYNFFPPPPTIQTENLVITPSCNNPSTGRISIYSNAISSIADSVRWILKTDGVVLPCNIDINNNQIETDCGAAIETKSKGNVKIPKNPEDAPIVIDNIAPGTYSLWLINQGGTTGYCYNTVQVTIPAYDNPELRNPTPTNVSCKDANDGSITVTPFGGAPNGYTFTVSKNGTALQPQPVPFVNGSNYTFRNLSAGIYEVAMINQCKQPDGLLPTVRNIEIKEPVKVNAETINVTQATCSNPANAQINILNVTGGGFTGTGNYAYRLLKNGVQLGSTITKTDKEHSFTGLDAGSYEVIILDADRLSCAGYTSPQAIIINPVPPVTKTSLTNNMVTCFGGNDGTVSIRGNGNTGNNSNLTYSLTNVTTNAILNNDDGDFTNLTADNYTVTIKYKASVGCNDTYTENITITQRPEIMIDVQNDNVTCKDNGDGILKAVVSGGTGNFSYQWQEWVNGNYVNYGANAATITGVEPGTYRVVVRDNGSGVACSKTSAQTIIAEPNALVINNVTPNQAICFGDVAFISVTAQGGNGNYTYYYKKPTDATWTSFSANTPIAVAGTYNIRAVDSKGCETIYNNTVTLSFPAAALTSSETLSSYTGGVNISCFGGSNGSVTINAMGGTAPYQYALDGNTYNTNNIITGINAGMHTVYIKDARGCIITKTYNFTQATAPINIAIVNITGVACAGDATGSINVNASGGSGSFTYSINNGTPQTNGTFTGLVAGSYTIKAFDANNCDRTITATVNASNPVIGITKTVNNINCFGGNTGSIVINATGGSAPLSYAWQNQTSTTNTINNIRAGTYNVTITDALGCTKTESTTLTEPTALAISTEVQALCAGNNNGVINITASGGTAPYEYSVNNGGSYSTTNSFNGLNAGNYTAVVKDANGCEINKAVTITSSSLQPNVSFFVATRQNERDTLIIKEYCLPTPDSVRWNFHPDAIVYTPLTARDPKIKFNNTGMYWAEMTASFGNCAYTIRRDIVINPFDPNAGPSTTLPDKVIKTLKVAPNPSNGEFNLIIELSRRQLMQVKIFNVIGGDMAFSKNYDRTSLNINERINIATSGTYVVRVTTENDSKDIMIVVTR